MGQEGHTVLWRVGWGQERASTAQELQCASCGIGLGAGSALASRAQVRAQGVVLPDLYRPMGVCVRAVSAPPSPGVAAQVPMPHQGQRD